MPAVGQTDNRINFSKATLDSLPIPASGKRVRYFDTRIQGLSLRVSPAGNKVFYLYRKSGGRPVEIKIGPYPEITIDAARIKAQEANVALATGGDPVKAAGSSRHEMTFAQLGEWWMEHARARKKSWKLDEWILGSYLAPLKNRRLSAITKGDLRRLHDQVGAANGGQAANRALELLRAMFNRARRYDIFTGENPALGVELNRKRSRDRRLTAGELPAFFEALEADPSEIFRDYVYLSLFTGARQANVLAMRWDEIDFVGKTWRIPETKNGLSQVIPLGEPELEVLQRRREATPGPWVLPSWSKTGHMTEPKNGWRRLLERAGIADLRMHDLRRTLGSWMADTGATLHVIGKTLGHQSSAATQIYARLSLDPIREAKARAVEAIKEAGSKQNAVRG